MPNNQSDISLTTPEVTISADKRAALTELLTGYGPFRRDQLRRKLLSKATLLRDEADAVLRAQDRFARLGAPRTNPRHRLLAEAAELEVMALLVVGGQQTAHRPGLQ
jgi:hypothetical protein